MVNLDPFAWEPWPEYDVASTHSLDAPAPCPACVRLATRTVAHARAHLLMAMSAAEADEDGSHVVYVRRRTQGDARCSVCGEPVWLDVAHSPHDQDCPTRNGQASVCGCANWVHPECCPDCAEPIAWPAERPKVLDGLRRRVRAWVEHA